MTEAELFNKAAKALKAYARFLHHFGVLAVKVDNPSPALQRLRDEVENLNLMADKLRGLAR